eukprot:12320731-Ditylum_brightwellii.AAC.1
MKQFQEDMERKIDGKLTGIKEEMETKIETTITKLIEKNEQMLKTEMEKIAQHSEASQGVMDIQTARVGKMAGTLAAQQEATKTK